MLSGVVEFSSPYLPLDNIALLELKLILVTSLRGVK